MAANLCIPTATYPVSDVSRRLASDSQCGTAPRWTRNTHECTAMPAVLTFKPQYFEFDDLRGLARQNGLSVCRHGIPISGIVWFYWPVCFTGPSVLLARSFGRLDDSLQAALLPSDRVLVDDAFAASLVQFLGRDFEGFFRSGHISGLDGSEYPLDFGLGPGLDRLVPNATNFTLL